MWHLDRYWWKWTWHCALGELLGIGTAGCLGFGLHHLVGEPATLAQKLTVLVAMLGAGSLEGSILGWWQWQVLRERLPALTARQWMGWTVAGAVTGWLLGMTPSLFFVDTAGSGAPATLHRPWVLLVLIGTMGGLLGGLLGWFQWLALRKHLPGSASWILANALGWGLGLGWIFLAASLPDDQTPMALVILLAVGGGTLAGLTVGAITGLYLQQLTRPAPPVFPPPLADTR